ncbi:MAG TPA: hypothetical protein VLT33_01035 [Labilithrix sp.]|nr:hypothetical protein [Labilithrix sp.]
MIKLRLASLVGFTAVIPALLVGCPEGAGFRPPGQDGGPDAADESTNEASTEEAGAGDAAGEGSAAAGSGALCGANGRDDCGAFLLCSASLGCVECKRESDCPASAAHCLEGTCVGCRPSVTSNDAGVSDCPSRNEACWASDDECHAACGDANPCPAGSTCDKASGACVGCRADEDCASGVCSPLRKRCVACVTDATCSGARPRCRVLTGTCEACTSNADCGHALPICDPATFTCRLGCTSDAQCPGQQCDAATAKCVALPVDSGLTDAANGG